MNLTTDHHKRIYNWEVLKEDRKKIITEDDDFVCDSIHVISETDSTAIIIIGTVDHPEENSYENHYALYRLERLPKNMTAKQKQQRRSQNPNMVSLITNAYTLDRLSKEYFNMVFPYKDNDAAYQTIIVYDMVDDEMKYGYIDFNGKEIIQPKYKSAKGFNECVALVSDDNHNDLVIDIHDNILFNISDYFHKIGLHFYIETCCFQNNILLVSISNDENENCFYIIKRQGKKFTSVKVDMKFPYSESMSESNHTLKIVNNILTLYTHIYIGNKSKQRFACVDINTGDILSQDYEYINMEDFKYSTMALANYAYDGLNTLRTLIDKDYKPVLPSSLRLSYNEHISEPFGNYAILQLLSSNPMFDSLNLPKNIKVYFLLQNDRNNPYIDITKTYGNIIQYTIGISGNHRYISMYTILNNAHHVYLLDDKLNMINHRLLKVTDKVSALNIYKPKGINHVLSRVFYEPLNNISKTETFLEVETGFIVDYHYI